MQLAHRTTADIMTEAIKRLVEVIKNDTTVAAQETKQKQSWTML